MTHSSARPFSRAGSASVRTVAITCSCRSKPMLISIISGVVSVPLLAALMWTASSKQLLGRFAVGRGLQALGWLTTALLAVAAVSLVL